MRYWFGGPFWRSPIIPWLWLFVLPGVLSLLLMMLTMRCE